jgi:pyruvate,orthophosphate dikinase
VLTWADEIVGDRLVVRCNADRGEEVSRAAALGARGVGLCRSEFQLGASATVLEAALGDDAESLDAIRVALRDALVPVLDAAGNEVVRVRLLDAPSHEFDLGLTEANPMLGTRGVRALLVSEQFAGYQARAIAEALDIHRAAGGSATVSVTVPMVAMPTELGLVAAVLREHLSDSVEIGVMIETPRAALTAGALAATASYFSFGTNDLTQLVYGLSRDDSDQLLVRYRELGVIDRSPFESLDPVGVARLIALAIDTGRSVQPMLRFGLCGEQGADPASIAMALHLGVGEVSVAPARVPTARMAAAHAVLAGRGSA